MGVVCWRCVEDKYLKEIVRQRGQPEECSLCNGQDGPTFTDEDFAELLDPILREHFHPGQQIPDEGGWEQDGDPLEFHLQEVIGQYLGFEEEIVRDLEYSEHAEEGRFYDCAQNYVPTPVEPHSYNEEWNFVSEDLKHRRRFFSSAASSFFERVFEGVATMEWWNAKKRQAENVVWSLPKGSELFRARVCSSHARIREAFRDPFRNVGPPPPTEARAGRMNVEGIAVFYGAMDSETCLAETRPALGSNIAVITLLATKELRVLDFTRLEECYAKLSYFQPDFRARCEKGAFLRALQRLISQPIVPGQESGYLITQTMAEFLAHVYDTPFEGILFKSVQRSGGTNVVLFPDARNAFPLSYVDKSIKLFSTASIQYEHETKYVHSDENEFYIGGDPDDEWYQ